MAKYEVLVGDMNRLLWVPTSGKLDFVSLAYRPVEGGHDKDGVTLYIVRAWYKTGMYPGHVSEALDGASQFMAYYTVLRIG